MNVYFCKKLKEARKESGMTQRKVASILNVVESCYANWEQGRTEPNITDLQNLCVIFDISANDLLGYKDESKIGINNSFNNNKNVNINGKNIQIGNKGNISK